MPSILPSIVPSAKSPNSIPGAVSAAYSMEASAYLLASFLIPAAYLFGSLMI
jgi:hypothetical protein